MAEGVGDVLEIEQKLKTKLSTEIRSVVLGHVQEEELHQVLIGFLQQD